MAFASQCEGKLIGEINQRMKASINACDARRDATFTHVIVEVDALEKNSVFLRLKVYTLTQSAETELIHFASKLKRNILELYAVGVN